MKKKLLVVLISAIMGLQLVGCGGSSDATNQTTSSDNSTVTDEKSKVVDDDTLSNEVAEVYLDVKEEYLEVAQNKQMDEWNEAKAEALRDLDEIKQMTPETDKTINDSIADIQELIGKYQDALDGKGADPTAIQNLESEIQELLFNK